MSEGADDTCSRDGLHFACPIKENLQHRRGKVSRFCRCQNGWFIMQGSCWHSTHHQGCIPMHNFIMWHSVLHKRIQKFELRACVCVCLMPRNSTKILLFTTLNIKHFNKETTPRNKNNFKKRKRKQRTLIHPDSTIPHYRGCSWPWGYVWFMSDFINYVTKIMTWIKPWQNTVFSCVYTNITMATYSVIHPI